MVREHDDDDDNNRGWSVSIVLSIGGNVERLGEKTDTYLCS